MLWLCVLSLALVQLEDKLLLGQTESYVEYDRAGRVVKGAAPEMAKSKYPEDEYVNNHTQVWGSWWSQGFWGYACCRSSVKGSYCTGQAGIDAASASASLMQSNLNKKEALEQDKADRSVLGTEPKKCVGVRWYRITADFFRITFVSCHKVRSSMMLTLSQR